MKKHNLYIHRQNFEKEKDEKEILMVRVTNILNKCNRIWEISKDKLHAHILKRIEMAKAIAKIPQLSELVCDCTVSEVIFNSGLFGNNLLMKTLSSSFKHLTLRLS